MEIKDIANLKLGPLEPLVARIYRYVKRFPIIRERIEAEYAPITAELRRMAKPYAGKVESYPTLPEEGVARAARLHPGIARRPRRGCRRGVLPSTPAPIAP